MQVWRVLTNVSAKMRIASIRSKLCDGQGTRDYGNNETRLCTNKNLKKISAIKKYV